MFRRMQTYVAKSSFYILLALVSTFSIMLTSCASIIHGSTDTVTIVSEEKDSKIFVDGKFQGWDDSIVNLKRGKQHVILATKVGCENATRSTSDRFDTASLWGILIDYGILTITSDLITGNAWETYPTVYNVTPRC